MASEMDMLRPFRFGEKHHLTMILAQHAKHAFQTFAIFQTPDVCKLFAGNPCPACQDLAAFDRTPRGLMHPLRNQVDKRRSLVRKINDRHDPLSYYLPFEISSMIFLSYYDNAAYAQSVESPDLIVHHAGTPHRLAAVCTNWGEIAFNIPSLWSSLQFSYSFRRCTEPHFVAQWLSRAGTAPLSVRMGLFLFDEVIEHTRHTIASSLDIVMGYSDRLKVLNLIIPSELCRDLLGRHLPLNVPRLETLELSIMESRLDPDKSTIISLVAPRLQHLHFFEVRLPTVKVKCGNLTSVHVTWVSIDEIFKILSSCRSLLECSFTEILDNSRTDAIPAIVHRSIHTMKLIPKDFSQHHAMTIFFERLSLPVLRKFTYNLAGSRQYIRSNSLLSFIIRSRAPITHLNLENIQFNQLRPSSLIALLQLLPLLTDLSISSLQEGEKFWVLFPTAIFEKLAASPSRNVSVPPHRRVFLPNLQKLEYMGLNPVYNGWNELTSALEHLVRALKYSKDASDADQNSEAHFIRPLHTVHFALSNLKRKNFKGFTFPHTVMYELLELKKGGISLDLTETLIYGDEQLGVIDILAHCATRSFSEFDDFPSDWFHSAT